MIKLNSLKCVNSNKIKLIEKNTREKGKKIKGINKNVTKNLQIEIIFYKNFNKIQLNCSNTTTQASRQVKRTRTRIKEEIKLFNNFKKKLK